MSVWGKEQTLAEIQEDYGMYLKLDGNANKWNNYPSFHEEFVRQITECFLQISLLGPT